MALVHTLLNHSDTKVKTVLVVSPLNTVLNWVNEFNMWLKDVGNGEEVNVFELSRQCFNFILYMNFHMFRIIFCEMYCAFSWTLVYLIPLIQFESVFICCFR